MDQDDVSTWDCSLCTYKNSAEKFKCEICDLRRGTSTRKPRCNTETIVAQVVRQQEQLKQQTRADASPTKTHDGPTTSLDKHQKNKRSHETDEDEAYDAASGNESDSTEIEESEVPTDPPKTEPTNKLTIDGNYIKTSQPISSGTTGLIIDKRRFKQLSVTVYDVTVTFTEYATRQNNYVRKKKRR